MGWTGWVHRLQAGIGGHLCLRRVRDEAMKHNATQRGRDMFTYQVLVYETGYMVQHYRRNFYVRTSMYVH